MFETRIKENRKHFSWNDGTMKKECFQTYRQEGYAREAEEICIGALSS